MVDFVRIIVAVGLIFLFAIGSVNAEENAVSKDPGNLIKKQLLVLGKVSTNPKKHYRYRLEKNLGVQPR